MKEIVEIKDILDYEIRSSWWAWCVPFAWMQNLAGMYFAWKVERKHARYVRSVETLNRVISQNTHNGCRNETA